MRDPLSPAVGLYKAIRYMAIVYCLGVLVAGMLYLAFSSADQHYEQQNRVERDTRL